MDLDKRCKALLLAGLMAMLVSIAWEGNLQELSTVATNVPRADTWRVAIYLKPNTGALEDYLTSMSRAPGKGQLAGAFPSFQGAHSRSTRLLEMPSQQNDSLDFSAVSATDLDSTASTPRDGKILEKLEAEAQHAYTHNLTQLVRLWFHHNVTTRKQWPEIRKECDLGCYQHGNCNHETGQCECPYGRAGKDCSELLAPACRATTADDAVTICFDWLPLSCECQRQCRVLMCGLMNNGSSDCALRGRFRDKFCWHWPGRPAALQLSDVPEENDTSVVYWRSLGGYEQQAASEQVPRASIRELSPSSEQHYVPLHHCPQACSHRGRCLALAQDQQRRVCQCYTGYHGQACEHIFKDQARATSCLNNCNGRGRCTFGFCHCERGWWGLDCGRSRAYGPSPGLGPARDRLRVYIYDLPSWVAHRPLFEYAEIYRANLWFLRYLSQDWAVRTENPWEANLFMMPLFNTHNGGNVGWQEGSAGHIKHAVQYVNATYPFWRRHAGKDHFYWVTNDWGVCQYPQQWPEVQNPIRIVHFGYHIKGPVKNRWFKEQWNCFDVHKDIVAAPHDAVFLPQTDSHWPPLKQLLHSKTKLLMYSGWIENRTRVSWTHDGQIQDYYSFGIRQQLSRHYANSSDPAVVVTERLGGQYLETLMASVFCLNPAGFGWAVRIATAAVHGCIPVMLQDGMYQPYEDLLPYPTFSLRFSQDEIPDMQQALQQIPPHQIVAMYRALRRYHKAFLWPKELGGKAYDLLLASLHNRVNRLWGVIYR